MGKERIISMSIIIKFKKMLVYVYIALRFCYLCWFCISQVI